MPVPICSRSLIKPDSKCELALFAWQSFIFHLKSFSTQRLAINCSTLFYFSFDSSLLFIFKQFYFLFIMEKFSKFPRQSQVIGFYETWFPARAAEAVLMHINPPLSTKFRCLFIRITILFIVSWEISISEIAKSRK